MYFQPDDTLLDAARAACIALPAAGLPPVLGRLHSRAWALVAPVSIVAAAVVLTVWSASAQALAWVALVLVPLGAALALGWAARGARPWLAPLAALVLVAAIMVPGTTAGEVARIALIGGAAVTAGRLVAGAAPMTLLKLGAGAMAAIDATFLFGHVADQQNAQFVGALAAHGLPQLQVANLGGASCDFADFFAAALLGAILAREGRNQLLAAAAVFAVTQAFDQLFLVVDSLPATVPPALVLLLLHIGPARRAARHARRTAPLGEPATGRGLA
jgi:hypothetical protein